MSFLYSVLKPIARAVIKSNVHQEESWEEFARTSHEIQARFKFDLPRIPGLEFEDVELGGCRVIRGRKTGAEPAGALVYLVGGGSRRWQMPSKASIRRYIEETGRELWLPLYPLYPDHTILDEIDLVLEVHRELLERFDAASIAWLGFSAGADLVMASGRWLVQHGQPLPMPGLMIAVSCCNMHFGPETRARMEEIEQRDIMMRAADMDFFLRNYDREGTLPDYIWGNAATDDYTGFPRVVMYFGGDEIFAAAAPDYEAAFRRCGLTDFEVVVGEGMFHAWSFFAFLPEGRDGERQIIERLRQ